jgi:hypothetical protein
MLFAFMGLLFTILLLGLLSFGWCTFFVDGGENVIVHGDKGAQPVIPTAFTPHALYQWFTARWCGYCGAEGKMVNGIYDMSVWNWGIYTLLAVTIFVMIWSYFGGAIARSAACEIAREGERIETSKALKYSGKKFWSFFGAPLICVLGFLFFYLVTYVAGLIFKLLDFLYIGAPLAAILLPLAVLAGFIMALIVLGTIAGAPLFLPAVAAEGTDAFDAFSRGFSYIYSKPWHYLWYQLVAGAYGYICIAFVILFTVFMLGLGLSAGETGFELSGVFTSDAESEETKDEPTDFRRVSNWALSYVVSREHAEMDYGWTPAAIASEPHPYGRIMYLSGELVSREPIDFELTKPKTKLHWLASWFVLAWLIVIMGLAYSFGISYFISQQTMIYFILRKKVDDIDVKEVYLEEEVDQFDSLPPEPAAEPKPEEEPKAEEKAEEKKAEPEKKPKTATRRTKTSDKKTKRRTKRKS